MRRRLPLMTIAASIVVAALLLTLRACDEDVTPRDPAREGNAADASTESSPTRTRKHAQPGHDTDDAANATTESATATPTTKAPARIRDFVLKGRLVEEDGTPIGLRSINLRLHVVRVDGQSSRAAIGNPEPDGTFQLEVTGAGRVDLQIRAAPDSPFAAKVLHDVDVDAGELEVTLVRGLPIRGSLVWPTTARGVPNRNVNVTAIALGGEPVTPSTLDDDGRFVTGPLDPSLRYILVAWGSGWSGSVADAIPGTTRRIQLVGRRETEITGRVLGPDGAPIDRQVPVWVRDVTDRGTQGSHRRSHNGTSGDGTFRIQAIAGRTYVLGAGGRHGFAAQELPGTVTPGARDVVVKLALGGIVSGRVEPPPGAPLLVSLQAARPDGLRTLEVARPKEDGTFTFHSLPSGVELVIFGGYGGRLRELGRVTPPASDLVLQLAK